MSNILKRIKTEVLIGPGPLHTNAEKKGFRLTDNAAWWAINHPETYQEIIKDWINVGCDFVLAATTYANRLRLTKLGLQDKTREINQKVIKLVKEITPNSCYVFCGLSGLTTLLPPMGDTSFDELYESWVEQIAIAEESGVDLLYISVDTIEQMELAIKALREHSNLPVLVQFLFNPTPKGFRTMTGLDPTTAAKKSEELGYDLIGTSCGSISYEEHTTALREMRAACNKYLATKPNAGVPELVDGKVIYPGTPEQMAKEAKNWGEAGARLIYGCCGTTPGHIAKVVAALK